MADVAADPSTRNWLRMLWRWLRPYRWQLLASLLLAVVGQGLLALVPLVQQIIVDDALVAGDTSLLTWIAVLGAIGVASFVAHVLRRYLGSRAAVDIQHDLRVAVHRHVHTLDARRHRELATGDVISRTTSDLNLIQMFISQVPLFVANITLLVVGLIVMALLSLILFAVVAASLPVLGWATMRLRRVLYPASFGDQVLLGQVTNAVDEEVEGVRLIRAFGQENRRFARFTDRAARLFASRIRTSRVSARWSSAMTAIPGFTQLGVLAVGGWLALHQHVSVGVFLAFASYVLQLAAPTRLLAAMVTTTQLARSGARRVFALLATTPDLTDTGHPLTAPRGAIELRRAHLTISDIPVLQDVDLRIEPSSRVAVVGPSGSGKTMLGMLIGRFYDPDRGSVCIGGTDLRDVSVASVRSAVTMVFDDSPLFTGTIRDNIALGRPGARTDEIETAARCAGAHGFISAFTRGYDTETGPNGISLSGGQRQRIALARAFLADPAILILDDATSALDARTERDVLDGLRQLMADRTTIIISNRRAAVDLADRIVVIEDGRITHDGARAEVVAESLFAANLLDGPRRELPDVGAVLPRPAEVPTPESWPDIDEVGADPAVFARLGLDADESGRQVHQVESHLRRALLALPPLTATPSAPDNQIPPSADHRVFAPRGALRPFLPAILVCGFLVLVDVATTLAAPAAFRFGIDHGISVGAADIFWLTCAAVAVLAVLSLLNSWLLLLRSARVFERILYALRRRLFAHLQRLPIDYFDQQPSGRILTRLTADVEAIGQLMSQGMVNAIVNITTCVGVLAAVLATDWRLALAMLATLPFLLIAAAVFVWGSHGAHLRARNHIADVAALLSEHLGRIRITQSYVAEDRATDEFARHSAAYRDARRRAMLYLSVFFPSINLLAVAAKALILLLGAQLIGAGTLSAGVLVAALLYVDLFFTPLQQLSMVLDLGIQARVAKRRIAELLATAADEQPNRPELASGSTTACGPEPGSAPAPSVTLQNVGFSYTDSRGSTHTALDDINLTIPAGTSVALVGTTGAGKSTLVKLLLGFYRADQGSILIGGRDVTMPHPARQRRVAYVPQEPYLFGGTVASNIAFGKPDADQRQIELAARVVGAHDAITELPLGYQTPVRPGRSTLSAGQQQLICLARAELVDPGLLVLDEATANIDPLTELQVIDALEAISQKRTTVLIAHRLTTAARADAIVVMQHGRVVQTGSHADLLTHPGPYRQLWDDYAAPDPTREPIVNLSI